MNSLQEKFTNFSVKKTADFDLFLTSFGAILTQKAPIFAQNRRVPRIPPYNADHSKLQWINTACFTAPAVGELGNASHVPVVGPDFVNTDFSLIKQFNLPREMGLNFRAEFFNLFNHAQYGMPVNDIALASVNSSGTTTSTNGFGAVNSTVNNPRLIQLALKLTF